MKTPDSFGKEEQFYIKYTAQFVKDVQKLLKRFPPKHTRILGDHSTITFKPPSLDGIEIGKEYKIKILGRAWDEKGDALLVENSEENSGSTKKYKHITLSCAEGVSSEYSNELLNKAIKMGTIEYFSLPEEIEVVEGYSDGTNSITSK